MHPGGHGDGGEGRRARACLYVHKYIHPYTHNTHIRNTYIYIYIHIDVYMCTYTSICVYIYVCISMYDTCEMGAHPGGHGDGGEGRRALRSLALLALLRGAAHLQQRPHAFQTLTESGPLRSVPLSRHKHGLGEGICCPLTHTARFRWATHTPHVSKKNTTPSKQRHHTIQAQTPHWAASPSLPSSAGPPI